MTTTAETAPGSGRLNADQRSAFLAAFLGWTMDAFDYFIVVLVYADIAKGVFENGELVTVSD